jgi:hypothetical protein
MFSIPHIRHGCRSREGIEEGAAPLLVGMHRPEGPAPFRRAD